MRLGRPSATPATIKMELVIIAAVGMTLLGSTRYLWRFIKGKKVPAGAEAKNSNKREPLGSVVAKCEARWFLEELREAMSGDDDSMLRVGHMLLSGYGVKQDPKEAAKWMREAWAIQNYKEPGCPSAVADSKSKYPPIKDSSVHTLSSWGGASHGQKRSRQQAMPKAAETPHVVRNLNDGADDPSTEEPFSDAEDLAQQPRPHRVDVRKVYQFVGFDGLTTQSEDEMYSKNYRRRSTSCSTHSRRSVSR